MAELNDSLLQFDSGILDVNENLSNSENTLLSYSVDTNESLSPESENVKHKDDMNNKPFTVLSNNLSNMPDSFIGFVSNNKEDLIQNSNAIHNNTKSDTSNNFRQDMKLIDFSYAGDLNFPNDFGGMISDFNSEENCADAKDEEFHDAVQFFKDPSSLTFLENAGSASVPSDPLITRSSLYVNFDPLHDKFYSQSTKADLGGIAECETEPEVPSITVDPQISVDNALFKVPSEKMPEIFPENVPEILANSVMPEILSENIVPKIVPESLVPKVPVENIVPELLPENVVSPKNTVPDILAVNVVPDVLAENKAPEVLAENIVAEVQAENRVPEISAENRVPEISAENKVPEVLAENKVPEVLSENKVPEVQAENKVPEVQAENVVSDVLAESVIPEIKVPVVEAENIALDIPAENTVPEILTKIVEPEVPAVCEVEYEIVNKHLPNASPSPRVSFGNLLSFDSPLVDKNTDFQIKHSNEPPKLYTEEELQQALKIQELSMQDTFLKRQHDLELERTQKQNEMEAKFKEQNLICSTLQTILKELYEIILAQSNKESTLQGKLDEAEKEITKLRNDLKTSVEDLQSVESTFSDFHKRYEQCKSMLKDYTQNEGNLKLQMEDLKVQLNEKDEMYKVLQSRTQEMLDKANVEVSNAKKAGDAQIAVLKAQLKKAELKISSLESDNKHIKVENEKLSSICDELMAKVSES